MSSTNTEIEAFLTKNRKKYGIPMIALKALKDFGVFDARVLSVLSEEEIHNIPNISQKTAQALKRSAQDVLQGPLFQKGLDYLETQVKKVRYLTTGSKTIDKFLRGGLRTGSLVEVAGEHRTGKTQFCLTCAVTAQLPQEKGGLGCPVIYIDTTNSFDVQHYLKIGERFGLEHEHLLENLFIVKAGQLEQFKDALDRLPGYLQAADAKLVIVDSFIAPYMQEHHVYADSPVAQKEFYGKLGLLKRLAAGFNCVMLITNHVIFNTGYNQQFNPILIAGGHAFAHTSDLRLYFKKLRENMRRVKIEHCSWLPNDYKEFYLTSRGVYDEAEFPEQLLQEEKTESEEESLTSPLMEGLREIAELEVKSKAKVPKKKQGKK